MSSHRLLVVLVLSGLIRPGAIGLARVGSGANGAGHDRVATPANARLRSAGNLSFDIPFHFAFNLSSTYPSTYPSTPYPSTSSAAAYPSTSVPPAGSAALASYDAGCRAWRRRLPTVRAALCRPTCRATKACFSRPMTAFPVRSTRPMAAPIPRRPPNRSMPTPTWNDRLAGGDDSRVWQILPNGLMYKSYLAGDREPRFGTQFIHERNQGWLWDSTLGARVGLLRYGTDNDFWPQGWQWDIEGAAFPRLNLEDNRNLVDYDYRAGSVITTRQGPFEMKFGYYHYCSHIGDEYLLEHPDF